MRGRVLLGGFIAAGFLVLAPAGADAQGAQYRLVQCHHYWNEAQAMAQAGDATNYRVSNECRYGVPERRLEITQTGGVNGGAYKQWVLPAPPGTKLVYACLDHNLRRSNNSRPEILAFPGFAQLAIGGDGPTGWVNGQCWALDHEQLIFRMLCNGGPAGCAFTDQARMMVRNLDVIVSDRASPQITGFSGPVLQAGTWLRGSQAVQVAATDPAGAGLGILTLGVNGQEVDRRANACPGTGGLGWNYSVAFSVCPGALELAAVLDTARPPFVNGKANVVSAYAVDYPGSSAADVRGGIWVDNAPPVVPGFANSQEPNDPELIRAAVSDAHSGLESAKIYYRAAESSGEWLPMETRLRNGAATARVDPETPDGVYEFRLEARDVAGNTAATTRREDGEPMKLRLPLREPVELVTTLGRGGSPGQTVPYGTTSQVRGRLLDASGRPLAGREVVVVDRFDNGALFPTAERPAVTDEQGRFRTPVPAGPTRSIEARFAGTPRYQPAKDEVGKFTVRSAAKFHTSEREIREGETLVFSGRLRHKGARIPAGGKLIAIQYRLKPGRQRTLKDAFRTDGDGRFRLSYRFSKALTSDALFRFRTRIIGEGTWPYKGAATGWRAVVVRAD
jgi:hypothetical protein